MTVLFFIVLPLATILISIVLQKLLKSPTLVAILVFAVFLILAFTVFTPEFLINSIIYTLLAFITAIIVKMVCCILRRLGCNSSICNNQDSCCWERDNDNTNGSCGCGNGNNQNENNLEAGIAGLQDSMDTLEDNISTLNNLLSRLLGNNSGCGCNRSLRR